MAGQNGVFSYGLERAEGVPDRTIVDARFASETFRMSGSYEPDPNLDPSGNETEGENLQRAGTGDVTAAANSESWLTMRAHHHGYYEVATPAVGVKLWTLRSYDETEDTPVDHYLDSLYARVWRDVESGASQYNATGVKVTEFELSVEANKFAMFKHSALFLRDRYMALPSEVDVDAAYTGNWVVDGHRQAGDELGPDIVFKASTAGALGAAEIVFGSGHNIVSLTSVGTTATAVTDVPHGLTTGDTVTVSGATPAGYNVTAAITVTGTTTFTYTIVSVAGVAATGTLYATHYGVTDYLVVDDWLTVVNANDTRKGTRGEPIRIRPTIQAGDLFTVGDEWKITPTAAKPVVVYTEREKLNGTALDLRFSLNGGTTWLTKTIDKYTLKMGVPREAKFSLGSKYARTIGVPAPAKRWWEASFDRSYVDMDFERAWRGQRTISVHSQLFGTAIGSTGYEDYSDYLMERTKATAAGSTITTAGDLPETITVRAYSEGGSPLCIETHQNTVASIEPT
jgi:hypothetical protein